MKMPIEDVHVAVSPEAVDAQLACDRPRDLYADALDAQIGTPPTESRFAPRGTMLNGYIVDRVNGIDDAVEYVSECYDGPLLAVPSSTSPASSPANMRVRLNGKTCWQMGSAPSHTDFGVLVCTCELCASGRFFAVDQSLAELGYEGWRHIARAACEWPHGSAHDYFPPPEAYAPTRAKPPAKVGGGRPRAQARRRKAR